ncbi:Methyltransferase-like protein 21B [Balamuthia mandrillaris]
MWCGREGGAISALAAAEREAVNHYFAGRGRKPRTNPRRGEASSSSLSHAAKTGYRLWDSSIALAKYLEHSQQEHKWEGKRVLEVGAGCGLVGIALALQGANVVMTDLEEVLPNLQRNLQANKLLHQDTLQAEPQVRIGCLRWGNPLDVDAICANTSQTQRDTKEKSQEAEDKGFDYVVASDVIWLDHLVEPLVQTLVMVAKKGSPQRPTEIILAQETRSLRVERKFFEQMEGEGFSLHPVAWDELHPDFRNRAITIYRIRPTASLLHNSK